jgi:hypothetical protein
MLVVRISVPTCTVGEVTFIGQPHIHSVVSECSGTATETARYTFIAERTLLSGSLYFDRPNETLRLTSGPARLNSSAISATATGLYTR